MGLHTGPVGRNSEVDVVLGWQWPRRYTMQTRPGEMGQHAIATARR